MDSAPRYSAEAAAIVSSGKVMQALFPGNNYKVGVGLHDSSAALIPYLVNFMNHLSSFLRVPGVSA
jgi:hypothetical protein